jgi:hypothetical protein
MFCKEREILPTTGTVKEGIEFLTLLYYEENVDRRYSAINTARSALSSVLPTRNGKTFGHEKVVVDFMRGVFNLRPPKPKYTDIWDPNAVLEVVRRWTPSESLSLYKLSQKTVGLMLLSTGIRGHTLLGARTDAMQITEDRYIFHIDRAYYKQNRPGWNPEPVVVKAFSDDSRICPFHTLQKYLQRTRIVRGTEKSLFITTRGAHHPITRATLRRWIVELLHEAGVDTGYGSGSTRAAATSKALAEGAPLDTILASGGWSRPSTFQRFYARPIGGPALADYVLE